MRWLAPALALSLALPASAAARLGYEKDANSSHPTLWVSQDDGSHPVKVAGGGDFPMIAPNGSAVAFASRRPSADSELRVVSSSGGSSRRLAGHVREPFSTAWSPDSTRLAAVVGPELGANRLIVVDVATGATKTVAHGYISGLSWSPDGSRLVYGSAPTQKRAFDGGDLYVVAASGGTARALTHDHRSEYPVWGPKVIAFSRLHPAKRKDDSPKSNIYTIGADGSGTRQLTHQTVPFLLFGLTPLQFSGDGSRLLGEYGGQDTSFGQTIDPLTGMTRRIGSPRVNYVAAALSRDGSTILADRGSYDPADHHDVVTFAYGGGPPTTIVHNAMYPSWTR